MAAPPTNTNDRNTNKNNNNTSNKSDNDSDNHEHTADIMTEPGIVSEKWSSSQAHKTLDAQSKVCDTAWSHQLRCSYKTKDSMNLQCLDCKKKLEYPGEEKESE